MAELIQPAQHGIPLRPLPPSRISTFMPDTRPASPSASAIMLNSAEPAGLEGLAPADGGRQAWVFLVTSWFLETFIWGYSFAFGIVQLYLSTHAPFDKSSLAAIGAVGTTALAIQYIIPIFLIRLFVRYPDWIKTTLWTSTVVSGLSMIISSWATEVWQLILLQGILCGTAGAVLYAPVLMWLQDWWVVRRGFASGVIFSGTGVGGFAFPFLIGTCLERVGFAWTCRIWGFITLIVFAASVLTLHPRLPIARPTRGEDRAPFLPPSLSFIWHPMVIVMIFITLTSSLSFFPVSVYLPIYVESFADSERSQLVLGVFNLAAVVGQVFIGWLSDQIDSSIIIAGLGIGSCVTSLTAWGFADNLAKVFGFVIVYGAFSGICSVWSAVGRDVAAGDSQVSTMVFSTFGVGRGLASIVGPLIASALYDPSHAKDAGVWGRFGFRGIMIFVGVMAISSAALAAGLRVTKRLKTQ